MKVKEGESFESVKERVQAFLDVPDKEFEKYRVSLVHQGRSRYLDEEQIKFVRLRDLRKRPGSKNRKSKNNQNATNFFKLPPGSATSSTAAALQLQRPRTPRTSTSTSSLTKAMRAIRRNKH